MNGVVNLNKNRAKWNISLAQVLSFSFLILSCLVSRYESRPLRALKSVGQSIVLV